MIIKVSVLSFILLNEPRKKMKGKKDIAGQTFGKLGPVYKEVGLPYCQGNPSKRVKR